MGSFQHSHVQDVVVPAGDRRHTSQATGRWSVLFSFQNDGMSWLYVPWCLLSFTSSSNSFRKLICSSENWSPLLGIAFLPSWWRAEWSIWISRSVLWRVTGWFITAVIVIRFAVVTFVLVCLPGALLQAVMYCSWFSAACQPDSVTEAVLVEWLSGRPEGWRREGVFLSTVALFTPCEEKKIIT